MNYSISITNFVQKCKNNHLINILLMQIQQSQMIQIDKTNQKQKSDDPRLGNLIQNNNKGDIVIVGCPYDEARKRDIHKGGQDNAPDCLRRFFPKVGPLTNVQYSIDISNLSVSDYGNIFVDEPKITSENIIKKLQQVVYSLILNNQIPISFGGSKQAMIASVEAFNKQYSLENPKNQVIAICGRPHLKRLFDNDKLTSNSSTTKLLKGFPNINLTLFGPQDRYFPKQYEKNFKHIPMQQIRQTKTQDRSLGHSTQGVYAFEKLLSEGHNYHISLTVQAMQRFAGCRDITTSGFTIQQMLEIFFLLGQKSEVKSIDISEFNPSCQDYQSSLKLMNLVYYFLMGKAKVTKKKET